MAFEAVCLEESARAAQAEWKMTRWDSLKADIRLRVALDYIADRQGLAVTEAEVVTWLQELGQLNSGPQQAEKAMLRERAIDWLVEQTKPTNGGCQA